jgi:hypothetical protein
MKTTPLPTYAACARAAVMGWWPASLILGPLLFFDGVGPGLLVGSLGMQQAAYLSMLVAASGFVLGPLYGLLVGLPLLLATCRFALFPTSWHSTVGSIAGACSALLVARAGSTEIVPGMVVSALVAFVCSELTVRELRQNSRRQHAA